MIFVLTAAEMHAADAAARPSATQLMRDAGERIARCVVRMLPHGKIVAFAGPGNNGGDAFAALAELDDRFDRTIYAAYGDAPSDARRKAEARAKKNGVRIKPMPASYEAACDALRWAELAVDGLFGTGARLPLPESLVPVVRALDGSICDVLAIDIPSGIDADTGAVGDVAVGACATIALAALKPGHLLEPSRERCGTLWIADIGIDEHVLADHAQTFAALDEDAFLALLPRRAPTTDKRGAGAPLIVAGSNQFPGAAVLCARGAARAGAGYVTVATAPDAAQTLRAHLVEQVVVTFETGEPERAAESLIDVAKRNSAVGIGPGLGLDDWTGAFVRAFAEQCDLPMAIDASALFHFSKRLDILRNKPVVLTPHASEFARLSGGGTIRAGERVSRLREFVDRTGVTTLLKGTDTLVYGGGAMHVNATGTSALATAGTGDVLTGIITTLLSQGLHPVDAARAGAFWHGLAGRLAARDHRVGVTAGDLPERLGRALPVRSESGPLRLVGALRD